jgi:hypothetical protein
LDLNRGPDESDLAVISEHLPPSLVPGFLRESENGIDNALLLSVQQRGCYRTSPKRALRLHGRITNPPYVCLPAVMVAFAILGHIRVSRRRRTRG